MIAIKCFFCWFMCAAAAAPLFNSFQSPLDQLTVIERELKVIKMGSPRSETATVLDKEETDQIYNSIGRIQLHLGLVDRCETTLKLMQTPQLKANLSRQLVTVYANRGNVDDCVRLVLAQPEPEDPFINNYRFNVGRDAIERLCRKRDFDSAMKISTLFSQVDVQRVSLLEIGTMASLKGELGVVETIIPNLDLSSRTDLLTTATMDLLDLDDRQRARGYFDRATASFAEMADSDNKNRCARGIVECAERLNLQMKADEIISSLNSIVFRGDCWLVRAKVMAGRNDKLASDRYLRLAQKSVPEANILEVIKSYYQSREIEPAISTIAEFGALGQRRELLMEGIIIPAATVGDFTSAIRGARLLPDPYDRADELLRWTVYPARTDLKHVKIPPQLVQELLEEAGSVSELITEREKKLSVKLRVVNRGRQFGQRRPTTEWLKEQEQFLKDANLKSTFGMVSREFILNELLTALDQNDLKSDVEILMRQVRLEHEMSEFGVRWLLKSDRIEEALVLARSVKGWKGIRLQTVILVAGVRRHKTSWSLDRAKEIADRQVRISALLSILEAIIETDAESECEKHFR